MNLGLMTAVGTGVGVYYVYGEKGKFAAASAIMTGVALYAAYWLKLKANPQVNEFMTGGLGRVVNTNNNNNNNVSTNRTDAGNKITTTTTTTTIAASGNKLLSSNNLSLSWNPLSQTDLKNIIEFINK